MGIRKLARTKDSTRNAKAALDLHYQRQDSEKQKTENIKTLLLAILTHSFPHISPFILHQHEAEENDWKVPERRK